MKALLLATALAFGGTAAAQDMTAPAAPQQTSPMSTPTVEQEPLTGGDPIGGYQPAAPPMSAPPAPGQQVIFQPSVSPSQAYPPPAPLQSYPICKRGQYDNCRQRGG